MAMAITLLDLPDTVIWHIAVQLHPHDVHKLPLLSRLARSTVTPLLNVHSFAVANLTRWRNGNGPAAAIAGASVHPETGQRRPIRWDRLRRPSYLAGVLTVFGCRREAAEWVCPGVEWEGWGCGGGVLGGGGGVGGVDRVRSREGRELTTALVAVLERVGAGRRRAETDRIDSFVPFQWAALGDDVGLLELALAKCESAPQWSEGWGGIAGAVGQEGTGGTVPPAGSLQTLGTDSGSSSSSSSSSGSNAVAAPATPLYIRLAFECAASVGSLAVVQYLLPRMDDVSAGLDEACAEGHSAVVLAVLEHEVGRGGSGWRKSVDAAFVQAAAHDRVDVMETLRRQGYGISEVAEVRRSLYRATIRGHARVVGLLMMRELVVRPSTAARDDFDMQALFGFWALQAAVRYRRLEVLTVLLGDAGVRRMVSDGRGGPLRTAVAERQVGAVRVLVGSGCFDVGKLREALEVAERDWGGGACTGHEVEIMRILKETIKLQEGVGIAMET
ncbi:hypothetical protein HDU96_005837 [Phlyctochytrium bullatum]|nr:hypothetical protein HDU96_005837 [Phlyctochytrium bullatum]